MTIYFQKNQSDYGYNANNEHILKPNQTDYTKK